MPDPISPKLASPHFDKFREDFPARKPDLSRKQHEDELNDLANTEDVQSLTESPAAGVCSGSNRSDATKYLWLVTMTDTLAALEHGKIGKSTTRGRLAHTNLTGGAAAHAGGELWFRDADKIWLNGLSSRYRAHTPEELASAASCFQNAGYQVISFGWDTESGSPAVFLRGEPKWM